MASLNALINKIIKALNAQGRGVFIDHKQYMSKDGIICTKYIIHLGNGDEHSKKNNIIAKAYGKEQLLHALVEIYKNPDMANIKQNGGD